MKILTTALTLATLTFSSFNYAATIYDAGADFVAGEKPDGLETNTRGAWSYGYRSQLESTALNLVTKHTNSVSDAIQHYEAIEGYNLSVGEVVAIIANTGDTPITLNSGAGFYQPWEPNTFLLHPGAQNQFSIVRFTAPTSTTFDISANWLDLDHNSGNGYSSHIVVNGANILSLQSTVSNGGSSSASDALFLNQGDFLDFAVGSNGDYSFDSTQFNATISAVPLPTSALLLLPALVGFMGLRKQKNRLNLFTNTET
jgi:hypothetical protein